MPIHYTKRRVQFDLNLDIQSIQHCDYLSQSSHYYGREELLALHHQEIAILQQHSTSCISGELGTWRGLEDVRDGIDKQEKIQQEHTHPVVKFHRRKQRSGGCNAQLLRQVSMTSSSDSKKLAAQRAAEDAREQGYDDSGIDSRRSQTAQRSTKARACTTPTRNSRLKIPSYRVPRSSAPTA